MLQLLNKITGWASSRKGAKIVLGIWLAVIIILSAAAPTAKQFAISAGEGSIQNNKPSEIAGQIMNEYFPSDDGLTGLVVFYRPEGMNDEGRAQIIRFSEWLSSSEKPEYVGSALPFHSFPKATQDLMFSEDNTTMIYNFSLVKELDSDQVYDTIEQIKEWAEQNTFTDMQVEITGPAGISSDTLALFRNADLILLFATVGLILVLLIIIYRSPLLALIPLVIAGLVYQVVDRFIGLGGKLGWFVIDSQALSIMLILLFAVLTDYCLFVVARYREQLCKTDNKFEAMKLAMSQVSEPILFSGGTVLVAMLTLFTAIFKPYHNFAPVFGIAMAFILLGGLTLIPAIFALLGRKVFWPFTPKLKTEKAVKRKGVWEKIASAVIKRPGAFAGILLVLLLMSSLNILNINYSFNLMKSFPEELSSRQGYELLEQNFPKGKLAPVSVILTSEQEIVLDKNMVAKLVSLTAAIKEGGGVDSLAPKVGMELAEIGAVIPRNFLAENKHALKLEVTLAANPYDQEALNVVDSLSTSADQLLTESGFSNENYSIHFAGQTANQLDVSQMNMRDTMLTFILISILIAIILIFQARSVWLSLLMITTILLSYAATLGFGWLIFHNLLGYDAISYRIPVYTFVFLVALGVDYNIMLMSRIQEEAKKYEWKEAIRRGVTHTGGVISSAGIILAATFAVLITQPMQELFLFGITMTFGILLDTFLVRGILLPSILVLIGKKEKNNIRS